LPRPSHSGHELVEDLRRKKRITPEKISFPLQHGGIPGESTAMRLLPLEE
jgi:hypothetical protein